MAAIPFSSGFNTYISFADVFNAQLSSWPENLRSDIVPVKALVAPASSKYLSADEIVKSKFSTSNSVPPLLLFNLGRSVVPAA